MVPAKEIFSHILERKEEEFDLSSLKKSSVRGKSNRIKGLKGIDLDQFAEPKEGEK